MCIIYIYIQTYETRSGTTSCRYTYSHISMIPVFLHKINIYIYHHISYFNIFHTYIYIYIITYIHIIFHIYIYFIYMSYLTKTVRTSPSSWASKASVWPPCPRDFHLRVGPACPARQPPPGRSQSC